MRRCRNISSNNGSLQRENWQLRSRRRSLMAGASAVTGPAIGQNMNWKWCVPAATCAVTAPTISIAALRAGGASTTDTGASPCNLRVLALLEEVRRRRRTSASSIVAQFGDGDIQSPG
jgi:hypothetical protein